MRSRGFEIITWSVLITLSTAAGLSSWIQGHEFLVVRERLAISIPIALNCAMLLLVIGVALSWAHIKSLLSGIPRRAWLTGALCAALALVFGSLVAPRTSRILFDEQIYQQIGQTIAHTGNAYVTAEGDAEYGELVVHGWEYNKQPMGYPYLLSLLYRVFGVHEFLCWILNNLAFSMSTLLIFLIARLLSNDDLVSGFSALIYALIPMNAVWANTGAVEPTTVLTSLLAIFCVVCSLRAKTWASFLMAASACALAAQFRMESVLILAVAGFFAFRADWKTLGWPKLVFAVCLIILLLLPHLNHLYVVRGENWGSDSGQKFAWGVFDTNLRDNSLFFINNKRFPLVFTLLALLGTVPSKDLPCRGVLVTWFALGWGIFLPFYAGSYGYGADVRFSLIAYPPLALLAGYGAGRFVGLLSAWIPTRNVALGFTGILLLIGIWFFPVTRTEGNEGWDARLDWKYAREFADMVPPGSAILTHDPNMFLLWGKNAAQMSMVTANPDYFEKHYFRRYGGNVFLHWDYWCNADLPREVEFANSIFKKYETELIAEHHARRAWYRLYKIKCTNPGREAVPVKRI